MRIHTTKDGKKIKLRDMTDAHLAATIRLLERKASEGITVSMGGGSCPDEFWYDEKRLYGKAALKHMGYADYVKERDRRISSATGERPETRSGETPTVSFLAFHGQSKHRVACTNATCPVAPTVIGATRADAIRRWNTRKAKTPDVLDPDDYDVWFAMLYALADSVRSLVAAIEQINGKCQTREQRSALIIGREALAALQRLERAGRVGDSSVEIDEFRGGCKPSSGTSCSQEKA